jgi:glycine/D-amino acid oxidase-like deaminating enzyme
MGTAVAMHAARRSDPLAEPVLLLERTELAAGSSGRSGAILRQFYTDRELAGMARDSLRAYASFRTRTGYDVGFRQAGVLALAGEGRAEVCDLLATNVTMMSKLGIDVELIDAERIRALVPGMALGDGAMAAYEPSAGFVNPRRTVEAFAALARYYGATTRCGVEVTGLAVEDGRVRGVETADGVIEAEQVVLAAGPWTSRLLAPLGIELPLRVLAPAQCFFESIDPPVGADPDAGLAQHDEGPEAELEARFRRDEAQAPAAHPVILDLELGSYCRSEPEDERTRGGKMDYGDTPHVDDPDAVDDTVDDAFSAWMRERLVTRLPAYADRRELERQNGLYTVTPDAQATIGPLPDVAGLFLVAGFSGHGFKLAPSIGQGVTQMLWGEPVSAFDPAFFSPQRFAGGGAEWGGRFGL